ncbi:hypothetical protein B1757_02485 [Acidithiobacillus marinus]|uniref:Conjugal transfer protein n=1 Tax=Acidithiobacillus marinus TaxID=187490 RepID=A0A2I1DPQ2_9PROT|nr:hypothetical protein [Acidithiobacillus marinus]PKY11847.1 hypothetical protein B1757_02485 [Acidithiobacillus marinus]
MKKLTRIVYKCGLGFAVVALAGCASAPSVMSSGDNHKFPTLQRALKNTSNVTHWKGCSGSWGKYYRECQTEFILQTVGPAPLISGSVKSGNLPAGMQGLSDAINISRIVTGATMAGIGGVASGNMALGIAGLLLANGGPDLAGLKTYQAGNAIYATRFFANDKEAKAETPQAAILEANIPTHLAGVVVGHTSWKDHGVIWEPHEMRWRLGSGSYEIKYKARPASVSVRLSPVAVWVTKLKPLANNYALTDQWKWGSNTSVSRQEVNTQAFSKKHPHWIFVLARYKQEPLLCVNGVCKEPTKSAKAES